MTKQDKFGKLARARTRLEQVISELNQVVKAGGLKDTNISGTDRELKIIISGCAEFVTAIQDMLY